MTTNLREYRNFIGADGARGTILKQMGEKP